LTITPHGDRELLMTRAFAAPRELVFDALTKPELLQRWLGVRGGWTFPVCEIDLEVGGRYRYVWRSAAGVDMGMGGVYRDIVRPERIVCSERFDDPWYPGEAVVTWLLKEHHGGTLLEGYVLYESTAARDAVLASPMEQGVAESYAMLDDLLAELA
jgi:uncharacterized protein YndB with AHSA1/START domain